MRRLAADLNIPIQVTGCPIVRKPDGLAMSSRNLRLSPRDRTPVLAAARDEILGSGFARVEYLDLSHPQTLALAV